MLPAWFRRRPQSLAAILLAVVAASEVVLRLAGYRFSPLSALPEPAAEDVRAVYASGEAFTRFDATLMWTLDPARAAGVNSQGFCGDAVPVSRDPQVKLLFFLGDSSGCGPMQSPHWTAQLQALLDLNAGDGPRHQIVDAGVWGYSSFQGMRRFEQLLDYRPDIAFFAFGAGDAQAVRLGDAEYADRLRNLDWLDLSRLATAFAQGFGLARAAGASRAGLVLRVPPDAYRSTLREFITRSRRNNVTPVLVSPLDVDDDAALTAYADVVRDVSAAEGVASIDLARRPHSGPELPTQTSRGSAFQMALAAFDTVRDMGLVATARHFDSVVEPGRIDDHRAELGGGLWSREAWEGGETGRWTQAEATIALERRGNEGGLDVEARFLHPDGRSRLRVQVDDATVGVLEGGNGLVQRTLDVRGQTSRYLAVRLVADRPFVAGQGDTRTLGVFLHRLALVPTPYASSLELAEVPANAIELGSGWWQPEEWGQGQRGRWTHETADVRLGRHRAESHMLLDLAGGHPDGHAGVRVEVNGALIKLLRVENAPATYVVDVTEVDGMELAVRRISERPFVPRLVLRPSTDARRLGVFVRAIRLAGESG